MFGVIAAIIGLDRIDPAEMPLPVQHIEQPGTAVDIIAGFRMNPDHMQQVAVPQIDGFNPGQQVVSPCCLPPLQVGITDTPLVGIDQMQAAMPAELTVKRYRFRHPDSRQ